MSHHVNRLLVPVWILLMIVSLLLFFAHVADAEERRILAIWDDTLNTPADVEYYAIGHGLTTGPDYDEYVAVSSLRRHALFVRADLAPGDTIYIAVRACDANGSCSPWSAEAAHVVVADGDPNVIVLAAPSIAFLIVEPAL